MKLLALCSNVVVNTLKTFIHQSLSLWNRENLWVMFQNVRKIANLTCRQNFMKGSSKITGPKWRMFSVPSIFVFFFFYFFCHNIDLSSDSDQKTFKGQTINYITGRGHKEKKNKNKSSGLKGNFNTVRKTRSFHILLDMH